MTEFPESVVTLWRVTVVLGYLVFLPISVYWLHTLWRAASSIRRYARESAAAAEHIAANTAALPALDATISTATEVRSAAEAVAGRLDTIAGVMDARAGGR